jgi:hypothetical protein
MSVEALSPGMIPSLKNAWRAVARTCPVTGLVLNRESERLVRWNGVVAIVFLLVGTVAALLLALTRWQAIHLLPPVYYYRFLTLHGMNMLIFFILFFEMAILYFAGPVLLGSRRRRAPPGSASCSCWWGAHHQRHDRSARPMSCSLTRRWPPAFTSDQPVSRSAHIGAALLRRLAVAKRRRATVTPW